MCHYKYYDIMRKSKDNRVLRHQMVTYAQEKGIKPAMRHFKTSRNNVRKWLRRWQEHGYKGLEEISRRPHNSPGATPEKECKQLVKLKKKYKRMGADQTRSEKKKILLAAPVQYVKAGERKANRQEKDVKSMRQNKICVQSKSSTPSFSRSWKIQRN